MNKQIQQLVQHAKVLKINMTQLLLLACPRSPLELP